MFNVKNSISVLLHTKADIEQKKSVTRAFYYAKQITSTKLPTSYSQYCSKTSLNQQALQQHAPSPSPYLQKKGCLLYQLPQ